MAEETLTSESPTGWYEATESGVLHIYGEGDFGKGHAHLEKEVGGSPAPVYNKEDRGRNVPIIQSDSFDLHYYMCTGDRIRVNLKDVEFNETPNVVIGFVGDPIGV